MNNMLFLDSANLDEIASIVATDAISGVTTNPSLMAKEQKTDYIRHLEKIAQLLDEKSFSMKHLSVEVITLDTTDMAKQAHELVDNLSAYNVNLAVKIPVMMTTLPVISMLECSYDIRVNATACMTADQAKMAMDAGASYVSFFYNRMKDGALNANLELNRFSTFIRQSFGEERINPYPRVICGSIREPSDVLRCWENGADIVTAPMKVIKSMVSHPKTDEAIANFQRDIDEWLK